MATDVKRVTSFIRKAFISIATIKYATYVLILCLYIKAKNSLHLKKGEEKFEAMQQLTEFKNLMINLGVVHREEPIRGLLIYSLLCVALSSLVFRNWWQSHLMKPFCSEGLMLFLSKPEIASKKMDSKLDEIIKQSIKSNLNHTFPVLHPSNTSCWIKNPHSATSSHLTSTYKTLASHVKLSDELSLIDDLHINLNKDAEKQHLRGALEKQLGLLVGFLDNKTSLWLLNRVGESRKRFKRNYIISYELASSVTWLACILLLQASHILARKSLATSSMEASSEGNFSFIDRLAMIDEWFVGYISSESYGEIFSLCWLLINDQKSHLKQLSKLLHELEHKVALHKQLQIDNQLWQSKHIEIRRLTKRMADECDKAATEFYINFQTVRWDAKMNLNFLQFLINQQVCFIALSLLPALLYFSDVQAKHFYFFLYIFIVVMSTLNLIFFLCAVPHAYHVRTIRRIWGILAQSSAIAVESTRERILRSSVTSFKMTIQMEPRLPTALTCRTITTHTSLLWTRLIKRPEIVMESFLVRIFGIFALDYQGIIELNFWVMSLFIFSLTYLSD